MEFPFHERNFTVESRAAGRKLGGTGGNKRILLLPKHTQVKSPNPDNPGTDKIRTYLTKKNDCEDRQILRPRIVYVCQVPCTQPRRTVYMLSPTVLYLPCSVRYTFPDCEAHVRSVSNEPTSGCEARASETRSVEKSGQF